MLDDVRQRLVHGEAVGHLDRGLEHLGEAHGAVLGEHGHETAGGAGGDGGERAVLGRVAHAELVEVLRRRAGGCDAECVDCDHLAGVRVVDEGLGLAAPGEGGPRGGDGAEHGAGGVDGVAALLEDAGADARGDGLAGDGHPVAAVERRFLGAALGGGAAEHGACAQGDGHRDS